MAVFGSGKFRYEVIDNWARRPVRWPFTDAAGVAVDSRDRVYVFSRGPHPVMVFDRDGNFIRSWGEGLFSRPHGIFVDAEDGVWCTDDLDHAVRKFDGDGNLLMTLGNPGVSSDTGYDGKDYFSVKRFGPPFNRPTNVAVATNGDVFVTDGYGNARVHKFAASGDHVMSWGEPGNGPGQFVLPHSPIIDPRGRILVADRENHRMQIFGLDGALMEIWPDFRQPQDMAIDADGNLFVAEGQNRVSVWDLDGKMLASWGGEEGRTNDAGLFMVPHGIAVDSRGVLYVGEVCETGARYDRGSRAIQKFVPVGE